MKRYTALTKNFFRQLARGEQVTYHFHTVRVKEEKIIVSGVKGDSSVEFHYRRRPGETYGFSKEQFERIFSGGAKPLYTIRTTKAR